MTGREMYEAVARGFEDTPDWEVLTDETKAKWEANAKTRTNLNKASPMAKEG